MVQEVLEIGPDGFEPISKSLPTPTAPDIEAVHDEHAACADICVDAMSLGEHDSGVEKQAIQFSPEV